MSEKLQLRGVAYFMGETPPAVSQRPWIRFGPGEKLLCPLCSRRIGDVTVGTVVFVRRAGTAASAPSVVQLCEHCKEKYELQTLLVSAA